jgi:uncharacterized protein (TIGR02271 family)
MSGDGKNIARATPPDGDALGASGPDAPRTIRLHAEELTVARERVETGRVRVQVVTHEHEELVDIPLARGLVEVERVAINRVIEVIPPTRQEGDTLIVPVVHEVLLVERRLVLKEEVHVRRVNVTEHHQERVVLRHQDAVITRIPAEQPDAGPKGE